MSTSRWLGIALLIFAGLTLGGFGGWQGWRALQYREQRAAAERPPQIGVTEVAMQELAYTPAHIQVTPGTTVSWANLDEAEHDVTLLDGSVRSPLLGRGQRFEHTFATPGVYAYVCTDHPFMVGQVTVVR